MCVCVCVCVCVDLLRQCIVSGEPKRRVGRSLEDASPDGQDVGVKLVGLAKGAEQHAVGRQAKLRAEGGG